MVRLLAVPSPPSRQTVPGLLINPPQYGWFTLLGEEAHYFCMSPPVSATLARRSETTEESVRTEQELDTLLSVLEDADCRAVLEATGEEALSAKEIGDRCSIPSSTVYRKVEKLTDVGLLEERLRIHRTGKHTSEYSRRVEEIALTIGDSGTEVQMQMQGCSETPYAAD